MKKYICKKPCTLNGEQLNAGEIIPHDLLVQNRIPKLLSMGIIAEAPTGRPEPAQIEREQPKATNDTPAQPKAVKPPRKPAKQQPAKTRKAGE